MESNPELDAFWAKFRNFFNDINSVTGEKSKEVVEDPKKAARTKFTSECEKQDLQNGGLISFYSMKRVLIAAGFSPIPYEEKLVNLAKAIDAYNENSS